MNRIHCKSVHLVCIVLLVAAVSCDRIVASEQEPEAIDFQIVNTLHEPHLVSPKDGSTLRMGRPVTLRWGNIVSATAYTAQISGDSLFGVFLLSASTDTTFFLTTPIEGGRFYWRVRALNERLTSPWSSVRQFAVSIE